MSLFVEMLHDASDMQKQLRLSRGQASEGMQTQTEVGNANWTSLVSTLTVVLQQLNFRNVRSSSSCHSCYIIVRLPE